MRDPLPHPDGPYLSPYTQEGGLSGWVDEVIGQSSFDISGIASQLLGGAMQAYGIDNPGRIGGVLSYASGATGASTRDIGAALAIVGGGSGGGPGRAGLDLDFAAAALSELAGHGLVGESAGRQLRRIVEAVDDPQSALVSELGRRGIRARELTGLIDGLERLSPGEAEEVYDTMDAEVVPALRTLVRSGTGGLHSHVNRLQQSESPATASIEAVLARDDESVLSGAGEMLQRHLTDRVVRRGGPLGAGFMGLVDAMSGTNRQLDVTPQSMARYRSMADASFEHLDDMLIYTMVNHRSRADFARASEAMMLLYPQARPRMQAAHRAAQEIIIAEWHRMQQRMELDWETTGG